MTETGQPNGRTARMVRGKCDPHGAAHTVMRGTANYLGRLQPAQIVEIMKFFQDYIPGNPIYLASSNTSLLDRLENETNWDGYMTLERFNQEAIDRLKHSQGAQTSDTRKVKDITNVATRELFFDTNEGDLVKQGLLYIVRTILTVDKTPDLTLSLRDRQGGARYVISRKRKLNLELEKLTGIAEEIGADKASGMQEIELRKKYGHLGEVVESVAVLLQSDIIKWQDGRLDAEPVTEATGALLRANCKYQDLKQVLSIYVRYRANRRLYSKTNHKHSFDLKVDGVTANNVKVNDITGKIGNQTEKGVLVTLDKPDFDRQPSESLTEYRGRITTQLSNFIAYLISEYTLKLLPGDFRTYAMDKTSVFAERTWTRY